MKSKATLVEIRVALIFLRVGFSASQSGDIFSSGIEKENVKNIIKLELAQQLQMCSSKRKPVKKLTDEIPAMHEACVNQLMSKKFQVYDFDITSITPNDEKLTTVDKLDLDLDVVMNVMTKICPLCGNKNPDVKICKFCGGHLK